MLFPVFAVTVISLFGIKLTNSCDVSITDFGSVGNGVDSDDRALELALEKCSDGGRIIFPSGVFLLSPFNLTSNLELFLEEGSVLLASANMEDWKVVEPLPSYPDLNPRMGPFIGGNGIFNSSIRGSGTIDGQGSYWWDADSLPYGRGRLIEPMYCSNFSITGISIKNPPFWAVHPYACDDLLFESITFSAPVTSPNTDGIDPDSCSNVVIRNFTVLSCGDDAIAIKSGKDEAGRIFNRPSRDILIEGGSIGPSSGIDIGSEMSGGVYNVSVRDLAVRGALFVGRIKSGRGRGGMVRNVSFEDIQVDAAAVAFAITMHYSSGDPAPPTDERTPHVEDIAFRRITGSALDAGTFACLPESACRGLLLEDVALSSAGGFQCFRAEGTVQGEVSPQACF